MDPKELLLKHFEKLVLVLFLGFAGFVAVVPLASPPKELNDNEKLATTITKIEGYMRGPLQKPPTMPGDPTLELKKQCDPNEVPSADAFPAWMTHRRPSFAFAVQEGPRKQFPIHNPPIEFRVTEKGRGRVKVSWKTSPENQFVLITGYTLYRKDGEQGEYKAIKDNLSSETTEYEDTSVASRQKYWYRLTEHAATDSNHPTIVLDKTELPADKKSLNAEDTKEAVETPQDIYITLDSATPSDPIADPPKKGEAQIKVWRWNQTQGKFLSKVYTRVAEGDKIGKVEKYTIGKQTESIDFTTDAVILPEGIRMEKRKRAGGGEREVAVAKIHWNAWNIDEDLVALKEEYPPEIRDQLAKEKGGR